MEELSESSTKRAKNEVLDYISTQLRIKKIAFDLDFDAYVERLKTLKNFKHIAIPELTVQFLALVNQSFQRSGFPELLANCEVMYYRYEDEQNKGQLFALEYYEYEVYLYYHKNCSLKMVDEQVKFWKDLYQRTQKKQSDKVYGLFFNGKAAIFNYYKELIRGLQAQEKRINEKIPDGKVPRAVCRELYTPRKAFRGLYEIKTYILGVFSLVEYVCNCLLPFMAVTPEDKFWKEFLKKCKARNHLIERWTELFDESIVRFSSYVERDENGKTKDVREPAQVNIVNTFMTTLGGLEKYKALAEEYFNLKQSYRNVIAHGAIGYNFYDAITTCVPMLFEGNPGVPLFESLSNIDFHAYLRVHEFLRDFIEAIEALFPLACVFLENAIDIPVDVSEYYKFANGDVKKAKAYIELLNVQDIFAQITHYLSLSGSFANSVELRDLIKGSLEIQGIKVEKNNPLGVEDVYKLIREYAIPRMQLLEIPLNNSKEKGVDSGMIDEKYLCEIISLITNIDFKAGYPE